MYQAFLTHSNASNYLISGNAWSYPVVKSNMRYKEVNIKVEALLVSGSTQNFMEPYLSDQLCLISVNNPNTVILGTEKLPDSSGVNFLWA